MANNEIVQGNTGNVAVTAPTPNTNAGQGNVYFQPGTPATFAGQKILNNQETGAFVNEVAGNNRAGQKSNQSNIFTSISKQLQRKAQLPAFSPILTRETGGIFSPDNTVLPGINFGGAVTARAASTALIPNLTSVSVTQDGVVLVAGNEFLVKNGAIPQVLVAAAYASTGPLPANTYANGALGIGATLTANANGAFPAQDGGPVPVLNDRVLVQFEVSQFKNGLYFVSQVGSGATPWILTRVLDFDDVAEFIFGTQIPVTAGTLFGGHNMLLSSNVTVVGTSAVTFADLATNAGFLVTHAWDGTYIVGVVGGGFAPLTRATDMNTALLASGAVVNVTSGTVNGGKTFIQLQTSVVTLNVTPLDFENLQEFVPTALTQPGDKEINSDSQVYQLL